MKIPFIRVCSVFVLAAVSAWSAPYGGTPWPIPGTLQIEDFDTGGEGVGYHDTTPTNTGGAGYRTSEGVEIDNTPDGSGSKYQAGFSAGEWVAFTVNVLYTGAYTFIARSSAGSAGGTFHVEVDGVNKTGTVTQVLGPWLNYSTVYVNNISLASGQHTVKLVSDTYSTGGYWGFNWMHFELTNGPAPLPLTIPPPGTQLFYVSPSGLDTNPGTIGQPWKTLAKAAAAATAGQTVYIRAGTYAERLIPQNSGTDGNYIIFMAYPGETVTLNGNAITMPQLEGIVTVNKKSYIRVSGLRIINAGAGVADGTWYHGFATLDADHVVFDHNYISHIFSSGISASLFSNNMLIDNNELTDTNFGSGDNEVSLGIFWFSNNIEVRNNNLHNSPNEGYDPVAGVWSVKVHHNRASNMGRQGFYVDSWTEIQRDIEFYDNISYSNGTANGQGGFLVSSEEGGTLDNIKFHNNISYDNAGAGFAVTNIGYTPSHVINNVTIINNTCYKNRNRGLVVDNPQATNITMRNNISYQNAGGDIYTPSGGVTQDHNLTANPNFVNAASYDLHLQSNSTAIDAGIATGAPAADYDGNTRPAGAGYDIGAYEYGGTITPTITVTSPNGSEIYNISSAQTVTWNSANVTGNVNIDISQNSTSGPWVSLAANTANDGNQMITLPGTPCTTGRVRVSGVSGTPSDTSDLNFTIQTPPQPSVTVITPNGGESFTQGAVQTVTWTSVNVTENINIDISQNGTSGPWMSLAANTANDGSQAVTLPASPCTTGRVRVQSTSGSPSDTSNNDFTIQAVAQPSISVTAPNGGESYTVSTQQTVAWTSANMTGNVNIDVSANGISGPWSSLASNTANDGTQAVTLPAAAGTLYRVRVQGTSGSPSDSSDGNFTLAAQVTPTIMVTSPNGTEMYDVSSQQVVTWTSANMTGNINIDITTNGSSWSSLAANTANDGNQAVTMPATASIACKIRLQGVSGNPSDTSDNNFTVRTPQVNNPQIQISTTVLVMGEVEAGKTKTATFYVTNTGGGTLTGSVTTEYPWLTIDPATFAVANGQMAGINITATADATQTQGQFSGSVTLLTNGNNGSNLSSDITINFTATCVLVKPNPAKAGQALAFFGSGIVPGETTIRIYSLSGELLAVIPEGLSRGSITSIMDSRQKIAGMTNQSEISWTPSNLTPGIYVFVYESPKERGVGKFTVIK